MEGRVAIISGSTRGIGEAIVRMREERLEAKLLQPTSMSRITCMISQIQKMVNSYG
jgi:NAD(P)-dependent dehydrogenase (short-subunit alcohol dehydrogenase family)